MSRNTAGAITDRAGYDLSRNDYHIRDCRQTTYDRMIPLMLIIIKITASGNIMLGMMEMKSSGKCNRLPNSKQDFQPWYCNRSLSSIWKMY